MTAPLVLALACFALGILVAHLSHGVPKGFRERRAERGMKRLEREWTQ